MEIASFLLSGVTIRSIQSIFGGGGRAGKRHLDSVKQKARLLLSPLVSLVLFFPGRGFLRVLRRLVPPLCATFFLQEDVVTPVCVALRVNTALLTNTYPTVPPFEKGLYSKAVLPKTGSAYKSGCLLARAPRVYCISWLDACHTRPEWIT